MVGKPSVEVTSWPGREIHQQLHEIEMWVHYFADHLGSTRVVTNSSGSPCYEADFLPYGTENTPAGFTKTCSTNYKFTGYERDAETAYGTSSGNDYAFARYYNSRLGRFMSGDPLDGDITDPQTLNHYAYTRNNPIRFIDPTGLDYCEGADDADPDSCQANGGIWHIENPGDPHQGQQQNQEQDQQQDDDPFPLTGVSYTGTLQWPQAQANNKPGFWSCTASTETAKALGTTALDAIGIIPGGGNVLHGVQLAAGVGALALSTWGFKDVAGAGASTGFALVSDVAHETTNIAIHGVGDYSSIG